MITKQQGVFLGMIAVILLIAVGYMVMVSGPESDTSNIRNTTSTQDGTDNTNSGAGQSNQGNYSDQKSPERNTITEDEIASWKTYTNSEYGFSIKYPQNFSMQTGHSGPDGKTFTLAINSEPVNVEGGGQPKYLWIGVEPKRELPQCENSEGKIIIDSYPVDKCIEQGSFFGQGKGMLASVNYGNYSYFFSSDYYDVNYVLVDKIIASFKFTR